MEESPITGYMIFMGVLPLTTEGYFKLEGTSTGDDLENPEVCEVSGNPHLQLINPGVIIKPPWRCQLLGFFIFLYLIFN